VSFLTKMRSLLTERPAEMPSLPTDYVATMDLEAVVEAAARGSLRPQLVARWEVVGLFPDAAGRLTPRLQARWLVQEDRALERAAA